MPWPRPAPHSSPSTPGLECGAGRGRRRVRSEEHTSELQSRLHLVCRLLLEKKKHKHPKYHGTSSSRPCIPPVPATSTLASIAVIRTVAGRLADAPPLTPFPRYADGLHACAR